MSILLNRCFISLAEKFSLKEVPEKKERDQAQNDTEGKEIYFVPAKSQLFPSGWRKNLHFSFRSNWSLFPADDSNSEGFIH